MGKWLLVYTYSAAAAKLLSCPVGPTVKHPIDGSPPASTSIPPGKNTGLLLLSFSNSFLIGLKFLWWNCQKKNQKLLNTDQLVIKVFKMIKQMMCYRSSCGDSHSKHFTTYWIRLYWTGFNSEPCFCLSL